MMEFETKYRSPGNDGIERALTALGAQKIFDGIVEDTYFAHPARDFQSRDEALRLRRMEGRVELAYKGPRLRLDDAKAREEVTVRVDDGLTAQRILERLGFVQSYSLRKNRTSYLLDKIRIDIDDVEGLGQFVELELMTESPDRLAELLDLARNKLSLTRPETRTYLEMHIEKKGSKENHD